MARGLREADAAIVTLTERIDSVLLARTTRLKVIANCAVGYNNIDVSAAAAHGIVVANTPDVLTESTADLAWALLLAAARRIVEGHGLIRSGAWRGWEPTQLLGSEVSGKTLGIVGFGRIGRAVARRALGFSMSVVYVAGHSIPPPPGTSWRQVSLPTLLTESDFVSLHVPLVPETHHLIGAKELAMMRPTAFLINTSRGPIVDEDALADAVKAGTVAGAGLDVYEREPSVHPVLLTLPQVVTLPHLGSATLATRVRMGMMCVDNVLAVLHGRTAPNQIRL